jgi:L-lactate dehydrogenase (cytochrome)
MDISLPAILAPVGFSRLLHPGGEVAAAAAAGAAGTAYTLSTISGHKLENVRAASSGPVWYQLYLIGGRQVAVATRTDAFKERSLRIYFLDRRGNSSGIRSQWRGMKLRLLRRNS